MFSIRKTIFDIELKGLVGQKNSMIFTILISFESDQFVEKIFVPNAVESFLHFEKHRSDLYILLIVFNELMGKVGQ